MRTIMLYVGLSLILAGSASGNGDSFCKKYPYITDVFVGPTKIDDDSSAISFHRILITLTEIHQHIYVEKIVADEDMVQKEIKSSYRVPFDRFFDEQHIGELIVNDVVIDEWESFNTVRLKLDDRIYRITIKESLRDTEVQFLKDR